MPVTSFSIEPEEVVNLCEPWALLVSESFKPIFKNQFLKQEAFIEILDKAHKLSRVRHTLWEPGRLQPHHDAELDKWKKMDGCNKGKPHKELNKT